MFQIIAAGASNFFFLKLFDDDDLIEIFQMPENASLLC